MNSFLDRLQSADCPAITVVASAMRALVALC